MLFEEDVLLGLVDDELFLTLERLVVGLVTVGFVWEYYLKLCIFTWYFGSESSFDFDIDESILLFFESLAFTDDFLFVFNRCSKDLSPTILLEVALI